MSFFSPALHLHLRVEDGKDESLLPTIKSTPLEVLQCIIEKLAHLDLTGKIERITPFLKAHGGYCDVFTGELTGEGVKVAVKRFRIHMLGDERFAKVCIHLATISSFIAYDNTFLVTARCG